MISFPLGIKPLSTAVHAAAAWFIPGDDAGRWLEEIARRQVPMQGMRLYVLPASLRDRTPIGVLVDLPPGSQPKDVLLAIPYGRIAGRLFIPADAAIDPPASDIELREKLVHPVNVLHPSAGLIGFGEDDALTVADLLERLVERTADWSRAVAGNPPMRRLVAVEAEELPRVQNILEQGRDDIGSRAPEAFPPEPNEHNAPGRKSTGIGDGVGKAAASAMIGSLRFLERVGKFFKPKKAPPPRASGKPSAPPPPKKTGWLDSLEEWFNRRFAGMAQKLQDARLRELERLRKMLGENPDQGLLFAISLRDVGSRGTLNPGSTLTPRDINLNISSLAGGGKAADPWAIPNDMLQDLRQKYREAANRELRLGRYRRAAYIFAELLGDFSSAANALEHGRYFREAALLYRDHLKNRAKAAQCLEHGGLIAEAAVIHEELNNYEKAGDLYAVIEGTEDAERCYRVQVSHLLRSPSNPLEAARLLEKKLSAPDEALKALIGAGPSHVSAGKCLAEYFRLLGRLARHEDAAAKIAHLRQIENSAINAAILAEVLSEVATTYPESAVRTTAADATRVVAGGHLTAADGADRTKLARSVGPLAPRDRLLARDIERFLNPRGRKSAAPAVRAGNDPVVLRQFHLPTETEWKAVIADGNVFYALGRKNTQLAILRGTWDSRWECNWENGERLVSRKDWMLHIVRRESNASLCVTGILRFPSMKIRATDTLPECDFAGFGADLEDDFLSMAIDEKGANWKLYRTVLRAHGHPSDNLMAIHTIPFNPPPSDATIQMVAGSNGIYATWGTAILRFDKAGKFHLESMPGTARQLAATPPNTPLQVAVALHQGGLLLREDGHDQPFGDGLFDPMIGFTRGGTLIAANTTEGRVYQIRDNTCHLQGRFSFSAKGLLGVTATQNLNEFATFTTDGAVTVYQIPA